MQFCKIEKEGFKFPNFRLNKGELIRFWVQVVPINEKDKFNWGLKTINEIIEEYNRELDVEIKFCNNKVKLSLLDFIKPVSVSRYLNEKFGHREKEILAYLSHFGIEPNYTIRRMGFAHQKIFAIINTIENNDLVSFDLYGFAPLTAIELINYTKRKLDSNKSFLIFDNFFLKGDHTAHSKIRDIDILRPNIPLT